MVVIHTAEGFGRGRGHKRDKCGASECREGGVLEAAKGGHFGAPIMQKYRSSSPNKIGQAGPKLNVARHRIHDFSEACVSFRYVPSVPSASE